MPMQTSLDQRIADLAKVVRAHLGTTVGSNTSQIPHPSGNLQAYVRKDTLTTAGDIPYATAASTWTRLAIGASGRLMTSTGSAPQWVTLTSVLDDIMTTSGDTMHNVSGTITRLAKGPISGVYHMDAAGNFPRWPSSESGGLGAFNFNTATYEGGILADNYAGYVSWIIDNGSVAAASGATLQVASDTANSLFQSHASGVTITRCGQVLGGWTEFYANSSGFLIHSISTTSLKFGTNDTLALTISGTQVATFVNAPILPLTGVLHGNGASAVTALSLSATGDTIYASAANTLARLPIGATAGGLLKVLSGLPSWSTTLTQVDSTGLLTQTASLTGVNIGFTAKNTSATGNTRIEAVNEASSYLRLEMQGSTGTGGNLAGLTPAYRASLVSNNTLKMLIGTNDASPLYLETANVARLNIGSAGIMTMTTNLVTQASTTTIAGLNLPHGSAPTTPVNGDIWTTTAGLYVRINGATVGPLS